MKHYTFIAKKTGAVVIFGHFHDFKEGDEFSIPEHKTSLLALDSAFLEFFDARGKTKAHLKNILPKKFLATGRWQKPDYTHYGTESGRYTCDKSSIEERYKKSMGDNTVLDERPRTIVEKIGSLPRVLDSWRGLWYNQVAGMSDRSQQALDIAVGSLFLIGGGITIMLFFSLCELMLR